MKENKDENTYLKSYRRQKFTKYAMILGVSMAMATIATPLVETTQVHAATLSTAQEGFLASLTPTATQLAGDNDLYASVMLAQAILESGWGTSELAVKNYNLFGIKGSYNGETAELPTLEDDGLGNMYEIVAGFKKYPSYAEALQDYVNLLKNGTTWNSDIYAGAWMENTTSYADATKALTGVYATDTAYNTKLNRIIVSNDLNQYDNYGAGSPDPIIEDIPVTSPTVTEPTTTVPTVPNAPSATPTATATNYTVVKGDTLWKVSNNYGVPVSELKTLNNLTSDTIYVGQVLKLALPTVITTPTVTSPTVTTPVTNPTVTAYNTYTVVKGDTLWGVATKNNVTVASLKTLNNLTSDTILVGQVLNISVKAATTTTAPTTTPAQTVTSAKTYTVVSGDTLWGVATKNNVTVASLKTLNNLTSDVIYTGQVLKLSETTNKPNATPEAVSTVTTNKTYTVISGDTLWGVATKNNVTVASLKTLNKLTSDVIVPGQVLIVGTTTSSTTTTTVAPSASTSTTSPTQTITATTPVASNATSYTVVKGDTLYKIAVANNLSIASLKSYNNLTSDTIVTGQVLSLVQVTAPVTTPVTTPTTIPVTNTATGSYVVKSGDTLWSIATSKGLTVTELKTLNGLSSDVIVVGQTLKVTGTIVTKEPTVTTPVVTAPVVTSGGTYTVVSGDTLYKIAVANNLTVANLKSYNGLTSDVIIVGQTLKLSGTTATTTPVVTTPVVTTPSIPTTSSELSASFIVPASGYISSPFGSRLNPFTNAPEFHYGVDLAGSGAIKAAQSGKVVISGWHNSYGNYVIIDHGTINGKNVKTVYAHLAVRYVVVGDYVTQGQQIAVMGTTGDSTGVHLHFEVRENDYVVEPLNYIPLSYGSTSTGSATTGNTYTVKSGDTLWGISSSNGVSLASLLALNDLTTSDIYVGQTLTLR